MDENCIAITVSEFLSTNGDEKTLSVVTANDDIIITWEIKREHSIIFHRTDFEQDASKIKESILKELQKQELQKIVLECKINDAVEAVEEAEEEEEEEEDEVEVVECKDGVVTGLD